jgi:chaperone required for assembly of F1-ATPase
MKVQHLQKIKKFYKYVNVVEHPLSFAYAQKLKDDKPFELYTDIRKSSKYYGITIDHKILKSLNRYDLIIPNKTLAHAIAEEWIGQTDEMRTWAMPLNILHSQAIQLELDEMYRKHATNDIMGLLSDDQLCYDLDVESSINMYKNELIQSQRTLSKPIRDYMQERFKISLPSYKMIEERKIENSEIITELINKMVYNSHRIRGCFVSYGNGARSLNPRQQRCAYCLIKFQRIMH